jgi:adhesin transport system outer membrane protein
MRTLPIICVKAVLFAATGVAISACASLMPASHSSKMSFAPTASLPAAPTAPASAKVSLGSGQVSVEEAVRAAIAFQPMLDVARAETKRTEAKIDAARAQYNPDFKAGLNTSAQKSGADNWRPKLQMSVSQMVFDFGKISSDVDAKTAEREVSKADFLLTQDRIVRDTIEAFFEVQRYSALRGVAAQQRSALEDIAELVKVRTEKGASTRSDEMQAVARVQAVQSNEIEVEAQVQVWQSKLASLVGAKIKPSNNVPGWLEQTCDMMQPDLDSSPAVLQAQAKKQQALAELRSEQAQGLPTVSLEGTGQYDVLGSGGFEERTDYRIGLNISSSISNGGIGAANVEAAKFAAEGAEASIEASKLDVVNAMNDARAQISGLRNQLVVLDGRDDVLDQTRELYKKQYLDLGTRSLLDILNAEQDYFQSLFDQVNTTHDIRKLGVVCLYSSGRAREHFTL